MKAKRILALIISAVMVLSLLPATVFAYELPHQDWETQATGVYVAGAEVKATGYYNISVGDSELTTGVTTLTKADESDYDIYVDMENHVVKLNGAEIALNLNEQLERVDKICETCKRTRTGTVDVWNYKGREKVLTITEGTYYSFGSGNHGDGSCYYWPRGYTKFTFGAIGLALMDGEDWTLTLEGENTIDVATEFTSAHYQSTPHATQVHGVYSRGDLIVNGEGTVTINAANNCKAQKLDGWAYVYLSASGLYSGGDMTITSSEERKQITVK